MPTERQVVDWRSCCASDGVCASRLAVKEKAMPWRLKTYGTMAVDWEQRDRLRSAAHASAWRASRSCSAKSEMGALLCFDMNNVRYITATHIGTWAQDKISRFTLLPQNDEPILWDFGSAARHHQLYCPWLGERSRAGHLRCCAARCRPRWAAPRTSRRRSGSSSRSAACTRSRSASTSSSRRSCSRCRRRGSRSSTASS